MKVVSIIVGVVVLLAVLGGAWVLVFHADKLKPHSQADEDKPVDTDVAVKTATVKRATLRRYIEGYGAVEPEPAMAGKPAAGAAIASPLSGMVAEVLCEPGKHVEKDAVLIQLDERLAKAQEDQAAAALQSATATLARIKAAPRPEQLEVAQLAVDKATGAVELSQKNLDRQQKLPEQVVSTKTLETAATELKAARLDLQSAEKQLLLLKASPQELAEATAKMHEAELALSLAQTQRSLMKIQSPIAATVLRVAVNKGESVDPTKVLVEVAALDRLTVNVTVSAKELPSLKEGLAAEIRLDESPSNPAASEAADSPTTKPAEPATSPTTSPATSPTTTPAEPATTLPAGDTDPSVIPSVVKLIGYQVDRKTDTVQVWVSVPPTAGLRPGQYVRVRIIADEHADRLAVPVESVVTDADGKNVVVLVTGKKDDKKGTQTPVQIGLRDRNLVEVQAENLKEGDTVVSEGAYGLPKETKVHVIGD